MTDIASLLDNLFADLGGGGTPSLPTLPASLPADGNQQHIEVVETSRISRTSHTQNEALSKTDAEKPSNMRVSDAGRSRVTSSCVEGAGSAGSAGSGAKTLAGSTLPPFPQDFEDAGSAGSQSEPCGRPFLDLNHAAPQRPEWLSDDTVAALAPQLVPAPPPGDPLPISPSDVRAGVARELRVLEEDGREGPGALRDAVEITRAKIRNSSALAERQANSAACHVCDQPLDDTLPVIVVLSGKPGAHLFLHAACHDAYRARRTTLVDRIMASAGYGETLTNGEAA